MKRAKLLREQIFDPDSTVLGRTIRYADDLAAQRRRHIPRLVKRIKTLRGRGRVRQAIEQAEHVRAGMVVHVLKRRSAAKQHDRLVAFRARQATVVGEPLPQNLPAFDQEEKSVTRPLQEPNRLGGVFVHEKIEVPDFLFTRVEPDAFGPSDLSGEGDMMIGVNAVGKKSRLHTFVDEMMRGGTFRVVVIVPRGGSLGDFDGIFVGEGENFGAEAMFQGVMPGLGLALFGLGASRFFGVPEIDFPALFEGERHGGLVPGSKGGGKRPKKRFALP